MLLVLLLPAVLPAQQQQGRPRIGYVFPAGGRQGTTFDVTVGGQYLEGVSAAYFSDGPGAVQADVVEYVKPLTPGQAGLLRDQLRELMDRKVAARRAERLGANASSQPATRPWTQADEKRILEITKKLGKFQRPKTSPAIAEMVTLRVTIAPDARPGIHELRLNTPNGLTNPLSFELSQIPEIVEAEPRNSAEPTEVPMRIPAIANGQIMPGDVDRYRFLAKKGQHIVAAVAARQLIPYIADAVPGWFQATLALRDASGREIAFVDDYRFDPDPVLYYEIQKDGEYVLEIRDSIYRGREDFVYRLRVGELPFVTSVYPLGGPAGKVTSVQLSGWNLPVSQIEMDARGASPGLVQLSLEKISSQSIPFELSDVPEREEREPDDNIDTAQPIALPSIVNGRVGQPGDVDVFRFQGAAGEQVVAEVEARRLNSPLDSMLRLVDERGKQIAANDDHEDKAFGLETHHADSYISAKLPATGTYYLLLGDTQHKGGSDYAYRLRVSQPRPDFALRVVPSAINLRANVPAPVSVYALRQDGFAGEITLALENSPVDYTLSGARIPAGQDEIKLTMTAPRSATTRPVDLQLEGRAKINGKEIVRQAAPAEDMMQAFAYHHLVVASELEAVTSPKFAPRLALQIASPTPVKIPAGKTTTVRFNMPPAMSLAGIELRLADAPEGITIENVATSQGAAEVRLRSDSTKVKVGQKGNLIINSYLARKATTQSKPSPQPWLFGSLPAIPFEIVR